MDLCTARAHFTLLLISLILLHVVHSTHSKSDAEILLKVKASLKNAGSLSNWGGNKKPPCDGDGENWTGVLCQNGAVWGLKLENMGLEGTIDVEALKELRGLRTISLMNNKFNGPLPNLRELHGLKSVYLSQNEFSGKIDDNAFQGMEFLKKLYLDHNKFTGPIPHSLTEVPKLMELMLEFNSFEGQIPNFQQDRLRFFNASHNKLGGQIPAIFLGLNPSAFSDNKDLCGPPLESCSAPSKLKLGTIIVVAILVVAALAALVAVVIILRRPKRYQEEVASGGPVGHKKVSSADLDRMEAQEHSTHSKKGEASAKVSFLRDDREKFDMPDLLRASAEILGSGVFGSTYKAALNSGQVMVVKRFRLMNNVGREDFHEHMRRLGRLNHPNLLPLVAFYYRKEEKLLISDHVNNVSLAVHLHGNRSRAHPSLDWPTRLKIIKGVSRGLLYLYNELPSLTTPHGHLKSSNVLLDQSYRPILNDFGLIPVVNPEDAREHMVAYRSPEFKQNRRITKKTDVWSLGILILEILTGRFPSNFLQQGKGGSDTDLVSWAESIVRDESHVQIFDKDMEGTKNSEGEMMKLLKIGLECCDSDVEKRLDIKEAFERIDDVRDKDTDDEFYSSYASEADVRSIRGLSDDFTGVTIQSV